MTANQTLGKSLYDSHAQYKEKALQHRRFKHVDILPLINYFETKSGDVTLLGESIEHRNIYELALGSGDKNIMLWTQMHGDEPTSTMAIFDMLHFLQTKDDHLSEVRNTILQELRLCFIPMLNPDGAERFQRRNAAEIDLNRDAVALNCPESQILKAAHDKNQPIFGFNLHDQSKYYNVPGTSNTATHSFLAPAYNFEKSINQTRQAAMQGIALMQEVLDELHPQHSGRYNDDFEPRAFGDNIQSWGTSTILVEAGGLRNDPEKQEIRKLHFSILLTLLYNIAKGSLAGYSIDQYWAIPENDRKLNDLILRAVYLPALNKQIDIAINQSEVDTDNKQSFYHEGIIEDLGDLSTFFGYEELDAGGLSYQASEIFEEVLTNEALYLLDAPSLLKKGIGIVRVEKVIPDQRLEQIPLLVVNKEEDVSSYPKPGEKCAFFLKDDKGIKFAVINGKLISI